MVPTLDSIQHIEHCVVNDPVLRGHEVQNIIMCLLIFFFISGELHLTPLHGALQLRPSFEYLNKGEANAQLNASLTEEGIAIASS